MDYKYEHTAAAVIVEALLKDTMQFQIAVAVLPAIVGSCTGHASYDYEHHCEQALNYADELIRQIKARK